MSARHSVLSYHVGKIFSKTKPMFLSCQIKLLWPRQSLLLCFVLPKWSEGQQDILKNVLPKGNGGCQDNSIVFMPYRLVLGGQSLIVLPKPLVLPKALDCLAFCFFCLSLCYFVLPLHILSYQLYFVLSSFCLTSSYGCLYIWHSILHFKCSSLCKSKHFVKLSSCL